MIEDSNLKKPRPHVWRESALFNFIEECWNNSLASVANKNVTARRLSDLDAIFLDFHMDMKPETTDQLIPAFLFFRAFSSFRASVMMALCLPTDSFALQRSCLENAGYARLIADNEELSTAWLNRDNDATTRRFIRNTFKQAAIRSAIAANDPRLAKIFQDLYDHTIDFGAHPNEKSVTTNLDRASLRTSNIKVMLLPGDGLPLDHCLITAARIGICALKIFGTIFKKRFEQDGFASRVQRASEGL